MKQQITSDENGQWLQTLHDDESISVERLTSEQAAQWQAENKF